MQVNTGQDPLKAVHHVLQRVSAETDLDKRATIVLQALQENTQAAGVCLTLADTPPVHIPLGNKTLWTDEVPKLLAWTVDLPAEPTMKPTLPADLSVAAKTWATARPGDGGLVCIWFDEDKQADTSSDMFKVLLDLLSMVVRSRSVNRASQAAQLTDSILSSIADPLIVLDDQRRLLLMNPASESLFGIKAGAAVGMALHEVVTNEDLMKLIVEQMESGKVLLGDDDRPVEWTSPEDKTYLPRMATAQTPDGQPDGWILALRDVTQFKRLNRNQGEFMRIVSHDLRSPLTSMQGFADMIKMKMVGDLTEKQEYFVEKILAGITQMTSIVDNIQDAGRYDPETGFYDMSRSHCDLADIVGRIVNNHLVPAEKQNLTLRMSIADDVPIINADVNMMERAITNLVDNAIKYTPDGGTIDITVEEKADKVVISVADDGLGISEEDQKALFQRHQRIAREEHKGIKGTGLGLFIVASVAQRHGGEATVESELGKGTTFSIVIPLTGKNVVLA